MGNALHTPGLPGVGAVSPAEARLDDAGLIAAGATLLEPRTGVLYGPGAATLLTGTADTAPMTVAIGAHHWVSSRQASDGVYRGANEQAGRKVNIGAAPGSGAGDRVDVVYVKQGDPQSTVSTGHATDATAAPVYGVLAGTPGSGKPSLTGIPGAEEVGTVTVSPGAASTNGAGVAIANTARLTVARGAPIPVRNQAERDAITTPLQQVHRLDTGGWEIRALNGQWVPITSLYDTGWVSITPAAPITAASDGAAYRVKNGVCHFEFPLLYFGTWSANYAVYTFPSGVRPSRKVWFDGLGFNPNQRIEFNLTSSGVLTNAAAFTTNSNGGVVVSGAFPVG